MKFQIRLFKRVDGAWGVVDEKGKSNGMISNLQNAEADMIANEFTLCCRRSEAVDFLWTIDHPAVALAIKS